MKQILVAVVLFAWSTPAAAQPSPPPGPPAATPAPYPPPAAAPAAPAYPPPTATPAAPGYPPPVYYYAPPPLPVYEPPAPPPPMPTVSLTMAPILLILPVLQVTGEVRLGTQGGVALIAGGGRVRETASDRTKVTFHVYELGSQVRYYVTGNFRRGMQVGAQILYVHVNGSLEDVTGVAKGLALGPFVGWKTTTNAGFTFDVQGGVAIVTAGTKVSDSSGNSTSSAVDYIPLLNLNIGWSL